MEQVVMQRFVWFSALTQLKLKYRYTALGFLWNFLEPALFLLILSMVFSVVNRMDVADYAVFLFGALMPWRYFEKVVNACMDSIVGGDWLLKKIYVSPYALPLTRWMVASIEFLISMSVVLGMFLLLRHSFTIHLVVLPIAIIPWAMLGFGAGLIAAVLYTFFRDIKTIIQMGLMLAFFSSPILFRADTFESGSLQATLMRLHPITYFAALFQKPIYHAAWPGVSDWCIAFCVSAVVLTVGMHVVNKYKREFYFYL
jgi:lipopolysaccharide transport system permease protein